MKADGLDISSNRNVKVSCSDVSTHLKKNALVAGGLLRRDQIEYFSFSASMLRITISERSLL